MIETLTKNWWLLALCGLLNAILSAIYLDHYAKAGFHSWSAVMLAGGLLLAAGVITIAAGISRTSRGHSWLLMLNGVAAAALGLMLTGAFGSKISLRSIALLMMVAALSIGSLELTAARLVQRPFLRIAGAISFVFAAAFFYYVFRWTTPQPGSLTDLLWFGCYFAFSAICMLVLALRFHGSWAVAAR